MQRRACRVECDAVRAVELDMVGQASGQVENAAQRRGSTRNVAMERDQTWLHLYSIHTVETDNEVICVWIVE